MGTAPQRAKSTPPFDAKHLSVHTPVWRACAQVHEPSKQKQTASDESRVWP